MTSDVPGLKPRVVGMNHVALEVGDIEEALAFYGRLFEFKLRGKSDIPRLGDFVRHRFDVLGSEVLDAAPDVRRDIFQRRRNLASVGVMARTRA